MLITGQVKKIKGNKIYETARDAIRTGAFIGLSKKYFQRKYLIRKNEDEAHCLHLIAGLSKHRIEKDKWLFNCFKREDWFDKNKYGLTPLRIACGNNNFYLVTEEFEKKGWKIEIEDLIAGEAKSPLTAIVNAIMIRARGGYRSYTG